MKHVQRMAVLLLFVGLGLFGQRAWAQDNAELQAANQDVQSAQNRLNQSRQNYLKAVQTSGKDSPEAITAKAKLDNDHRAWQAKMDVRKQLRKQVRGEMLQRHAAGRRHSTAP